MRNTYIKPETLMVLIETQQMIALSMVSGTANGSDALSRQGGFFDDDASGSRRRGRSVWDEEEEF